jgi:hypothetical protein
MTIGEFAQLMTAMAVCGNVAVSWKNGRKLTDQGKRLEAVHVSTNGLSERAEVLAKALGVAEGKATEKELHNELHVETQKPPFVPPHSLPSAITPVWPDKENRQP